MHRHYFPPCQVAGPIDPPVAFAYGRPGFIPNKCAHCTHFFEGECRRGGETVGRLLHLDHGPCGMPGPTDPVTYENAFLISKVQVPRKCASCRFVTYDGISGFGCGKDARVWGERGRGLDWGTWRPDVVYFDLPAPKVTTTHMCRYVTADDALGFITEHRRVNPGLSIAEARADFATMRAQLGEPNQPRP